MEQPFSKRIATGAELASRSVALHEPTDHLFAVPEPNAVGTNDLDNAITLLRFAGEMIHKEPVVADFFPRVSSGDFRFLPVLGDTHVAYTQSRGLVLLDYPARSVTLHTICSSFDETIQQVALLDARQQRFVFQIRRAFDPEALKILRVVQCRGEQTRVLDEALVGVESIGYEAPWLVHGGKLLVYRADPNELCALSPELELDTHPLCLLYGSQRKRLLRLEQVAVHPSLPFAVLVEINAHSRQDRVLWLARWEHPDPEQRLIPLYPSSAQRAIFDFRCSGLQFSPDGSWLVLRDHTARDQGPRYLALQVQEHNEYYLGQPKNLGSLPRPGLSEAWTTQPLSLVVTDGQALHRWDFRRLPYV